MNSQLPFVPRGAKARGMARRHSPRHPFFRQRWFADDIIITCVRWYLRFKLSYRDLAELVRELGVGVAPSTILRRTRDVTAAKSFFRKALKRHGEQRLPLGRSGPDSKLSLLEQCRRT